MTPRREWPWAVAAAACVLAIGVGGAFLTAPRPMSSSENGVSGQDAPPVALKISGTAPTAASNALASGVKLAWTKEVTQLNIPSGEVEGVNTVTVVNGIAVAHVVADDNGYLIGIDPGTGDVRWQSAIDHVGECATAAIGDSVYCFQQFDYGAKPSVTVWRISANDGSIKTTTSLSAPSGSTGMTLDQLDVFDGAVVAVEMVTGADGTQLTGTVARLSPDLSSVTWTTNLGSIREGDDYWPALAREQSGVLVISDNALDVALDFASGSVIETDNSGTSDVDGHGDVVVSKTDAPPATGHTVVQKANATPVDFESSAQTPPLPVYYTSQSDGTVLTSGYRTDGITSAWHSPVSTAGSSSELQVFGAYADGNLVLVDTAGHVTSVDPATGAVRWSNSYAAPPRIDDYADYVAPQPFFVGDTLVVADRDPSIAGGGGFGDVGGILAGFSAQTGALEWTETGMIPAGVNQSSAPLLVETPAGVGALVGMNATSAASAPTTSALPSCPAGLRPVSWSTYPGGHVLLCAGDGSSPRYVADVELSSTQATCRSVDFTALGYALGCDHHLTVQVTGGGAVLQFHDASGTWLQPASNAWSNVGWYATGSTGTGFGAAPAKIPASCPSGAVELSLSTWHGGWLLVCGTDALHATSFAYRVAGHTVTGTGMQYQDGRYCGADVNGAAVCVSGAPAVVTVTPKGGTVTQYSVDANTFAATGAGGAGKGTGAYQVKAPDDTANDEVRYLVQILQKSESGRAQAQALVSDIASCSVSSADVSTAASLVENRQQLLSALASTPVDKVAGGLRLVSELTAALQSSLKADQLYQQAASDMAQSDCGAGNSDMAPDTPEFEDSIGAQKATFVSDWNSTIAGKYDNAPTFDAGEI